MPVGMLFLFLMKYCTHLLDYIICRKSRRIASPMTCLLGDAAIQTALGGHGRSAREMTLNTWVGA